MALSDNLFAYYPFNQSSLVNYASGAPLTPANNITTSSGGVGGGSKYLSAYTSWSGGSSLSDWQGWGDFSLQLWVKLTASVGYAFIGNSSFYIQKGGSGGYSSNANDIRLTLPGGNLEGTPGTITSDVWHQLVVTRSGSSVKMYWDGNPTPFATGTIGSTFDVLASANNYIGNAPVTGNTLTALDELAFWKRELTSNEVETLYTRGTGNNYIVDPATSDLSSSDANLLLHLNDSIADSSASAHVFTNNGSAGFATGKFGNAITLTGSQWLSITATNSDFKFGTGDFTVDLWAKFNSSTGGIFTSINSTFSPGIQVFYSSTTFKVYDNANELVATSGPWTYETGVWHHLAFVRSGNLFKFFVDGKPIGASSDVTGKSFSASHDEFAIGAGTTSGYNYKFDGSIDEFRVVKGVAKWDSFFAPPTAEYAATSASILTGTFSFAKNTLQSYELDAAALEALEPLASDPYFSDSTNWKSVSFRYQHSSGQMKQILFTNDGSGTFRDAVIKFSAKARTGSFPLASIVVTDLENDKFTIRGADLPTNLDITLS